MELSSEVKLCEVLVVRPPIVNWDSDMARSTIPACRANLIKSHLACLREAMLTSPCIGEFRGILHVAYKEKKILNCTARGTKVQAYKD